MFLFYFQKIYAKAIYDNLADTPDELAFKKGDILTVIEQDSDGCEGWWLCTVRGRQVLKIIYMFKKIYHHHTRDIKGVFLELIHFEMS